jgi:hypothetical protein
MPAALVKAGHSLRVAIAGADEANFPMPKGDNPAVWSIYVGGTNGST